MPEVQIAPKIFDIQKKQEAFEEKFHLISSYVHEYPELKDVFELLKVGKYREFAQIYNVELIKAVAKRLEITPQGITILGGKPYVNKTGLTYKVQKDPRQVKYIKAYPVILPIKMLEMVKGENQVYFLGYSEDGTAMHHGVVEFKNGELFEDEGEANAKYLTKDYNKMSTMIPYTISLSATRATNRAMRLATGVGLVSMEELYERIHVDLSPEAVEQIKEIRKMFKELDFNEAKQVDFCSQLGFQTLESMPKEVLQDAKNKLNKLIDKGGEGWEKKKKGFLGRK